MTVAQAASANTKGIDMDEMEKLKKRIEFLEFKVSTALILTGLFFIMRATIQIYLDFHTH